MVTTSDPLVEGIAIVGAVGRFPGARDLTQFWRNLCAGTESVSVFTDQQLADAGFDPRQLRGDPRYVAARGVVEQAEWFDATFFGYTPREARLTDPQHRLFLEAAWEALENASCDPSRSKAIIGVFAGCGNNTWARRYFARDLDELESGEWLESAIGNEKDYLATRVAYKLNLRGPAVSVNTACSTSLVAVCQACQALWTYQCDVALAGGVNVTFPQSRGYYHDDEGISSPDGHTRAFDAEARGTVFSNGLGIVVLKRLSEAIEDGHEILAVIRGAAINNDGGDKASFTAPSADGQADVIALAQGMAGVSPDTVSYVEAHGTATPIGDVIELMGLTNAFRLGTSRTQFCAIGSVKSNIGHLEHAAGVAGLIKTALSLKHRLLPPSLFHSRPNPRIDFANSPFYVNTTLRQWDGPGLLRAGVSSFGVGGTNAHVVIDEPPVSPRVPSAQTSHALPLSAMSAEALAAMRENLAAYLRSGDDFDLADAAFTLQEGRQEFPWRAVVVASQHGEAAEGLTAASSPRLIGANGPAKERSVVFMFPGGGAQYPGAARHLYQSVTAFRDRIDGACDRVEPAVGRAVRHLIGLAPEDITPDDKVMAERPSIGLPLLFIIEHALAEQWRAFGVQPQALIGHSVGEYVAATLAGVFSLDAALDLVQLRGRLFETLPPGSMLSVAAPVEVLTEFLDDALDLAVINGPSSCVVSGPSERIELAQERLTAAGFEAVRLHIAVGAHSAMVEPALPEFRRLLQQTPLATPTLRFVSNVTGDWITDQQATDPEYWVRHLRQPVRFSEGLERLFNLVQPLLLEVGPGRVLSSLARQHPARPEDVVVVESMRHPNEARDDREQFLRAAGRLWTSGVSVSWSRWYDGERRRRLALPTYPFERKPFLPERSESGASSKASATPSAPITPPLLRNSVPQASVPAVQVHMSRPADRQSRVLDELTGIMQRLSGVERSALDPDVTFLDLGFESLLLGQVSLAINRTFGVRVKFRHFFEETPTLRQLASHLDQQMPADKFAPPATPTPVIPVPAMMNQSPTVPASVPLAEATGALPSPVLEHVINQQLELMRQQLAALGGVSAQAPVAPGPVPPVPAAGASASLPTAPPAKTSDRPSSLKLFGAVSRGAADGNWLPIAKASGGGLTPRQQQHLDSLAACYNARTKGSKAQAEKARTHLVDPRSVAGFGPIWKELVYQIASNGSSGAKLWDVDGNEYVDVTMGFGSALFGHAPAFMTEAMSAQMKRGYEVGLHSPLAAEAAALFCEMTGSDRVCFCTSGTDAVIGALRAARAVTGKDRIATFIGDIHGRLDEVLGRPAVSSTGHGSMPLAAGIPEHIVGPVITLEYGVAESLEVIRSHAHELAAILVEPVRTRQPDLQPVEFLRELRRITQENQIALVMDEVVTGFRVSPGGAQQHFGIKGDLATWGKAAAGGMPIGMISGRAEYMNVLDGGRWRYGDNSGPETPMTNFGGSGTFGKHPLTMAATLACLRYLKEAGPSLQEALNARTTAFVRRLNAQFQEERLPVHVEHFSSFFLPRVLGDRRFEALLFHHLRHNGVHIYLDYPCFLSTAHSDADIDFLIDAFIRSARAMKEGECLSEPGPTSQPPGDAGGSQAASRLSEASGVEPVVPEPAGVQGLTPSAPGHVEIWLAASRSDEANIAFNQVLQVGLDGPLDLDALRSSVNDVVARHDALRSVFTTDGLHFSVWPSLTLEVPIEDFSHLDESGRARGLAAARDQEVATPFALDQGPLVRARLVRVAAERHVLLFSAHHLVCDGWSLGMVAKDLGLFYSAATTNRSVSFDPHMQFREYLAQRDPEEARESEEYWLQVFSDGGPVLQLPTDHPRPRAKTYASKPHRLVLGRADLDVLRRAATAQNCTLFNFLIAAYGILLHRLTGQDDLVVGVAAAGQAATGCDDLVGHCVSMLPSRSRVSTGTSIGEYVAATKRSLVNAYDHQQLTFGSLLPRLRLTRDAGRIPLVSTLLTHETETGGIRFGDLTFQIEQVPRRSAIFDVEMYAIEDDQQLALSLWLNSDLFDDATGPRWLGHYKRILFELIKSSGLVCETALMEAAERDLMLQVWNRTDIEREAHVTVPQLVARQVSSRPSNVAVECNGEQLTYAELDRRVTAVANELVGLGVGPNIIVGLMVERSVDLVVALLGILKAGGAYLPLDPTYPTARLEDMLTDAAAPVVVTHRGLAQTVPLRGVTMLPLETIDLEGTPTARLQNPKPHDLAYVIYTSGSTGRPKGVELMHASLVNVLLSIAAEPGFTASDSILAVTTLSFDVAASELLLPLVTGGKVIVATQEAVRDGGRLRALLDRTQPTFMHPTPATWRLLLEAGWQGSPTLTIASTGEPLPRDLADQLLTRGRAVWNLYGPTETTIWSTAHLVEPGTGVVPIGRPIANTRTYILDSRGQPVPIGVIGELYIGGRGLARGYRNRADLTAERFVSDPFSGVAGARMYRTGDLARYRPDGTIECLARIDQQVKLRGFRIELGEVEEVIQQHPDVNACAVLLQGSGSEARLVAYLAATRTPAPVDEVREFLKKRLPHYMVPSSYVVLDALPLGSSGKIDRRALAETLPPLTNARAHTRVLSPTETTLTSIWKELLDLDTVSPDADFFDLGGHSLLAMRMVTKIRAELNKQLPLGVLFEHRTIAQLARLIAPDSSSASIEAARTTLVALRGSTSSEIPLFLVHAAGGEVWSYADLAAALPHERPVYGIQADAWKREELPTLTVPSMAARYIEAIRSVQPAGPYYLGGFCAGSILAYEMASQLRREGEEVGILAILDHFLDDNASVSGVLPTIHRFLANLPLWVTDDLIQHDAAAIRRRLASKARLAWARLRGTQADVRDQLGMWRMPDYQVPFIEAFYRAVRSYRPPPYHGRVALLRARSFPSMGPWPETDDFGWNRATGQTVEVLVIPGSHGTLIYQPFVGHLASRLDRLMGADGQAPAGVSQPAAQLAS